jgi:phage shock protein A
MSIKRLLLSVWSRIDHSLGTLENHDAVAKAVITEIKQNRSKAVVRFRKLEDDHKKLEAQIESHKQNIDLWTQRAKEIADSNEQKALECLKRRRTLQAAYNKLEHQYQEQGGLIARIESDIRQIDAKVEELEQKRSVFRTRAASSAAYANIALLNDSFGQNVDDLFLAWDEKLSIHECQNQYNLNVEDPLLNEFSAREELISLKNELSELTK